MKFWTIQAKSVIDIIQKDGVFQPDFSKSRYLKTNFNLKKLYSAILMSFNNINNMDLPGLVYAFTKGDGNRIDSIESIEEFREFIKSKKAVIDGFWEMLDKKDVVILELNYDEKFNPIFIDINDFQLLMPPIMILPPFTEKSFERICTAIDKGKFTVSELQSNVIQAHLPYIKAQNIVNTYPIFNLD